jgi:hypothetical protein
LKKKSLNGSFLCPALAGEGDFLGLFETDGTGDSVVFVGDVDVIRGFSHGDCADVIVDTGVSSGAFASFSDFLALLRVPTALLILGRAARPGPRVRRFD